MVVSNLVFHDKKLSWKSSGHLSGHAIDVYQNRSAECPAHKNVRSKKGGSGGLRPPDVDTILLFWAPPVQKTFPRHWSAVIASDPTRGSRHDFPSGRPGRTLLFSCLLKKLPTTPMASINSKQRMGRLRDVSFYWWMEETYMLCLHNRAAKKYE